MKKLLLLIGICVIGYTTFAQAPQGINYQAVARTSEGEIVSEESLIVRISISSPEALLWQEDHDLVTNQLGLFSMQIGDESATKTGGNAESFSQISWETGGLSMSVEIDMGSGFITMGESLLMSVPYALFAGSAPSNNDWVLEEGTLISTNAVEIVPKEEQEDTPLFEVRNSLGVPVFSVYDNGVVVTTDVSRKGIKGGFAVGGYNATSKSYTNDFLYISPDSVRIYIPEISDPEKGIKGGFAVGGYNASNKFGPPHYLQVTPEESAFSGSMYVDGDLSANTITATFPEASAGLLSKPIVREQESHAIDQDESVLKNDANEISTESLIELITKQQKQIEELEKKIQTNASLERRIAELESKLSLNDR